MELNISLLYGSVRTNRKGIVVARYLEKKLIERKIKVNFIDPLQYNLPLLDKMYREYGEKEAPETMGRLAGMFNLSDGFVIVTGEYNHSIPPALKNLLDHFQREYYFKPSAIASYSRGSFGGVRAAMHLREIVAELGMPAISSTQPFPMVNDLFTDNLTPKNELVESGTMRFLDEFVWYAGALKNRREQGVPY